MKSDSDPPALQTGLPAHSKLNAPYQVKATSAHRTPAATHICVKDADLRRGLLG